MATSLESIFLACFVLIAQNRQAASDRIRSDVEYAANIKAGLEVTQLHAKVDTLYAETMARLAAVERDSRSPSRSLRSRGSRVLPNAVHGAPLERGAAPLVRCAPFVWGSA
jgi:uncharacterized membrane protein